MQLLPGKVISGTGFIFGLEEGDKLHTCTSIIGRGGQAAYMYMYNCAELGSFCRGCMALRSREDNVCKQVSTSYHVFSSVDLNVSLCTGYMLGFTHLTAAAIGLANK